MNARNGHFLETVPHPSEWPRPFDLIAATKVLFAVLSGSENSGAMRQGALTDSVLGLGVGASGLNSAIDEAVSRRFIAEVGFKM